MIIFSHDEKDIIKECQLRQLEKPTRAGINGESAFVMERISKINGALAMKYWHAICLQPSLGYTSLDENQRKLYAIDDEFTMPSWGTSGT